jgi:cytochrome c6
VDHSALIVKEFNITEYSGILVAMFGQQKLEWSNGVMMMMRIHVKAVCIAIAFAVVLSISSPARAQDASAALFKSKCAGCHGADGTGSAMGKKMGAHDFTSADVQKMSDAELTDIITNGKNKMPKYGSLKPEEVKGLVAYIRTLKK